MRDIKAAFEQIHAGEELKRDTLTFLQDNIRRAEPKRAPVVLKRLLAACACLLILTFAAVFLHGVYFTETMYVDMDINPSVELAVNRFDNVIGVYAYNEDGESLLRSLDLLHKPYQTAAAMLTKAAAMQGYLSEGGLVSVTMQSDRRENALLIAGLQTDILAAAKEYFTCVQADVFTVDSETRQHAHEQEISPAKYLAILELLEVDSTATMDSCKSHSIGEIRALTEEHGDHHEADTDGGEAETPIPEPEESAREESSVPASGTETHGGGHHEAGHD